MNGKKIFTNILFVIFLGLMIFSGWNLWKTFREYKKGDDEYQALTDYVREQETDPDEMEQNQGEVDQDEEKINMDPIPISVDFESLKKINPDVIGWIYIEGTQINYPVVQTDDNVYYLHHTFEKTTNRNGAIFMDYNCDNSFGSDNSIIFGHNMKTGKMFGQLKRLYDTEYNKKADFSEHPRIWILMPGKAIEYQIYAAREISVSDPADESVYLVDAATPEEYQTYLDEQKSKSQYDTGVSVQVVKENSDDYLKALTLSTCTSSTKDGRFVVQAIEIGSAEY